LVSDRAFCDVPVHSVSEKLHDVPKRALKHWNRDNIMFARGADAFYGASECEVIRDDDAPSCVSATGSILSFAWSVWTSCRGTTQRSFDLYARTIYIVESPMVPMCIDCDRSAFVVG
jgi:hypothetical protein